MYDWKFNIPPHSLIVNQYSKCFVCHNCFTDKARTHLLVWWLKWPVYSCRNWQFIQSSLETRYENSITLKQLPPSPFWANPVCWIWETLQLLWSVIHRFTFYLQGKLWQFGTQDKLHTLYHSIMPFGVHAVHTQLVSGCWYLQY